jgi:hypothetical protein
MSFWSCQTPDRKTEDASFSKAIQIESKIKILNESKSKTQTAKAQWYVHKSGLLRLDILGPFDILMAQGFRDANKVTLVDHRQKTILSQSNQIPLIVDGFEIPINDLAFLLLDQSPKGWSCKPNTFEKLNCHKGPLESMWTETNTLNLIYSPYHLEIKILNRSEIESGSANVFQFVWPKTYKIINPSH